MMAQGIDLRDSVESIDTENVLLPLLERLGIDTSCLRTGAGQAGQKVDLQESSCDSDEEEIVYIVDRFGCVVLDNDGEAGEAGEAGERDERDGDWRITSSTSTSCVQTASPSMGKTARPPSFSSPSSSSLSSSLSSDVFLHTLPQATRQAVAVDSYRKYNKLIFDDALPHDMEVSWNKKLTSTAGLTHYKRRVDPLTCCPIYSCRIELATKVLDTASKLERTLIHEMCHCAAWMIDHVAKPPHGEVFKKYARRAMAIVPGVDVSTCHNYQIFYPYRWQCVTCCQEYGRHSKSIDVEKKACGGCRGRLVYLGKFVMGADGRVRTPSPVKTASGYSAYVKVHFHRVKNEMEMNGSGVEKVMASEVMKKLAVSWANEKRH